MSYQYWIIAGILLGTLLLWVLIKRNGVQAEAQTSNRKALPGEGSRTASSNSSARLALALDLAERFFQQGEREVASRYIDEVLEEGSEKQKEHARQLMERFPEDSPTRLSHSGTANQAI